MSAELLLISAIVDEGPSSLRRVYSQGVSTSSFAIYDEEFAWIERRVQRKKNVSLRTLREQFPDFEYQRAKGETIDDLADELKRERALAEMNEVLTMLASDATKDNVLEMIELARERFVAVTRRHAPMADVNLDEWRPVIEQMKQRRALAAAGESFGILTEIPHIDFYMGGFQPGQFIGVNGRTGSAKSYSVLKFGWPARFHGRNVGIFSPEFNDHEVRCRYHTLASADKRVQEAVGLQRSFYNKALMAGVGFNLKTYGYFMEYLDSLPGSMRLLCGAGKKERMTVGYIEDRLVEYELDLVIVDPIYLLAPVREHRDSNVYQEVAWIAEELHRIGEQYQVPIVFTNQAHLEGNKGDAPGLKDSFGAKAILHLADWVLGVQHMSEENILVIKANKGRFGETFRFTSIFNANTGHFELESPLPYGYRNGNGHHEDSGEVVKKATGRKKKEVLKR